MLHPSGQYLYAANEVDDVDADKSGGVSAFRIDRATGALDACSTRSRPEARIPATWRWIAPGTHLLVANYTGGTLAVLPLGSDGSLGSSQPGRAAQGVERQHRATVIAARALHRSGRRQRLRDLVGPGRRSAVRLPLRRPRAAACRPDCSPPSPRARRRAAALRVSPGRAVRLCHQRAEFDRDVLPLGRASAGRSRRWRPSPRCRRGFAGRTRPPRSASIPAASSCTAPTAATTASRSTRSELTSGILTLVEHEPTRGKTPRNFTIDPSGQWLIAANQDERHAGRVPHQRSKRRPDARGSAGESGRTGQRRVLA